MGNRGKIRAWALGGAFLGLVFAGCAKTPLAPSRVTALAVSIPLTRELRADLLGNSANAVKYQVDGDTGIRLLDGTTGAFSAPASTGSVDLTLDLPPEAKLLSLQLDGLGVNGNGLPTTQTLAVGAVALNPQAGGSAGAVVDLGSVVRNCYTVNNPTSYAYYSYGFNADNYTGTLAAGSNYDIQVEYQGTTSGAYYFYLADASGNTRNSIAYMGTGDWVTGDGVPAASRFSSASTLCKTASLGVTTSSFIEADDIYCVKLNTIPGGFAWVRFLDAGAFPTCPSFAFRINRGLPYYAYDQTDADLAGTCSGSW